MVRDTNLAINSTPKLLKNNFYIQEIDKPSGKWKYYLLLYETGAIKPLNQSGYDVISLIDGKRRIKDICRIIFESNNVKVEDMIDVQEGITLFFAMLLDLNMISI